MAAAPFKIACRARFSMVCDVSSLFRFPSSRACVLATLLSLISTRSLAAESRFWQLTFAYTPQTLAIERAAQIPPMDKVIRTPGLDDAVAKLDYDLEWLDAQGRVLLSVPVTVPFRGRTTMGEAPQGQPHREHVMPSGA